MFSLVYVTIMILFDTWETKSHRDYYHTPKKLKNNIIQSPMSTLPFPPLDESETTLIRKFNLHTVNDIFQIRDKKIQHLPAIIKLKKKCIAHFDIPIHIFSHSWMNLLAHTYIKKRVKRVVIQEIVLKRTGIEMKVKHNKGTAYINPLHIIGLHFIWLNNAIISDAEEDDCDDSFNKLPTLQIQLSDSISLVDEHASKVLKTHFRQVNELVDMVSHFI